MKNRKHLILIPLLLVSTLFLPACGSAIKESLTEKAIEQLTDGEVDIDTKDGEVSFGTEDSSLKAGEDLDWPAESMASLPEPEASIMSITDLKEENSTTVVLLFDKEDGGLDYMQELEDLGYVQRSYTKMEMGIMYLAAKDDNTLVALTYDTVEGSGSITLTKNDDSVREFFENRMNQESAEEPVEINMDESMDWPEDRMEKIPPIEAQITSVTQDSDRVSIGFKGVSEEDMIAYIEEIKDLGFDTKVTEMIMDDFLSYTATNETDQIISINWSSNEGSITYTK